MRTRRSQPEVGKVKKKMTRNWKIDVSFGILYLLCFVEPTMAGAQPKAPQDAGVLALKLKEAQVARLAAEQRSAQLDAAIQHLETELEGLRRRYCDLYLQSAQQQQQFADLELAIAGLLAGREDVVSGRALSRALAALDKAQSTQHKLSDEIRDFGVYLDSVLDVLQPSEVLRREVTERFAALTKAAQRSIQPLPSVAGRGGGDLERQGCRVLAVNDDLQIIVLDRGADDGLRQGTHWRVMNDGKLVARLRVIEVRPSISAAVVVNGGFKAVAPGAAVAPHRE